MALDEDAAIEAMQRLATPLSGDPPVVAGESGAAGLAGLIAALQDRELADSIGLDARSSVLVINTEGATDPTLYRKLMGRHPHEVLSGKKA